jgi:hypothetical protein
MAQPGAYFCWPADSNGTALDAPDRVPTADDLLGRDLLRDDAVTIYFGPNSAVPQPPPKEQRQLQEAADKLVLTARRVYRIDHGPDLEQKKRFRSYYIRAFQIAAVGLEGANPATEIATTALADLAGELVDDEAMRVKSAYLRELGWAALKSSFPFACMYLLVKSVPTSDFVVVMLGRLGAHPDWFSAFMLLWIGCFLGVWLSYGIRKKTFTLTDLTRTEDDRMSPLIRLWFAGSLTMLLGIVFAIPVVDVQIGSFKLSEMARVPMIAFLIGALCGISELVLPSAVEKRATDFFAKLK